MLFRLGSRSIAQTLGGRLFTAPAPRPRPNTSTRHFLTALPPAALCAVTRSKSREIQSVSSRGVLQQKRSKHSGKKKGRAVPAPVPQAELKDGRVVLTRNGVSTTWTCPNQYLLDHCRCPKCFHSGTKQRLKCLSDFDPNTRIRDFTTTPEGIQITWDLEDGHTSLFPWSFLQRLIDPSSTSEAIPRTLWGNEIAKTPPSVDYERLMSIPGSEDSERAVLDWMTKVAQYGFCFVDGVPATPEATEEVIKRIGAIRHTHYGGFWDFTADMSLGDLAYSSQGLPAHTDSTYFTDPSGLQIFHLLSHPPPGQGGTTLLVDGYNAAVTLEREHPALYQALVKIPVPFHASGNEGLMYRTFEPVLRIGKEGEKEEVELVRWNNEDRGVLVDREQDWDTAGPNSVGVWYEAARAFEGILRHKENEYWVQLKPGTVCVIDNWRVLHGRSAFTGSRRMCGAYVGRDDWRSRLAVLQRRFERETTVKADDIWDYGW